MLTPRNFALAGYRAAYHQFTGALSPWQGQSAVAAAVEAVHWAAVLDACLRSDPDYVRLAGSGADVMSGLRWLCTRTGDQLPLAGEAGVGLRWIASDDLRPRDAPAEGELSYRDQFEGRPVGTVLGEISRWFTRHEVAAVVNGS